MTNSKSNAVKRAIELLTSKGYTVISPDPGLPYWKVGDKTFYDARNAERYAARTSKDVNKIEPVV